MRKKQSLDIVIPSLNEEDVILHTLERVGFVVQNLAEWECRVILVDDGSTDGTVPEVLKFRRPTNMALRVISLSRNFGHQAALSAGLEASEADAVVVIDADLQDPPEMIPAMLDLMMQGHDVVYGKRRRRAGASLLKRIGYFTFYRLLRGISSGVKIPLDSGDFRLISGRLRDHLVLMPERQRFIRGMIPYLGFSEVAIEYSRPEREAGETKYSWRKLFGLAVDGVVSSSVLPLRLAFALGAFLFVLSSLAIVGVFVIRFATAVWVPGWATTTILLLGFGGLQFLFLGILGEYIARIFHEVKARPVWVIKDDISV